MPHIYTIKNISFTEITKAIWWSKYPADFEINKKRGKYFVFHRGFIKDEKFNDLESAKRYCRKLHIKDIETYLMRS